MPATFQIERGGHLRQFARHLAPPEVRHHELHQGVQLVRRLVHGLALDLRLYRLLAQVQLLQLKQLLVVLLVRSRPLVLPCVRDEIRHFWTGVATATAQNTMSFSSDPDLLVRPRVGGK
eukprot:1186574-Prorocentrum_minimum.AAC.3